MPRDPSVPFYLPQDAQAVTDAKQLAQAEIGPDWNCQFCQGENRADAQFCVNCGASRDGSSPRPVLDHRPQAAAKAPAPSGWKTGCPLACLGCLGVSVLMLLLIWWLGSPRHTRLEVLGHTWQRVIQTSEYREVSETAWEGEVPSGASVQRRSRELHHTDRVRTGSVTRTRQVSERVQSGTERVKVGVRDKGNGYFEDIYENRPRYTQRTRTETYEEPTYRDVPVYSNRVYYQIWKWVPGPDVKAEAQDLDPHWPGFSADSKHRERGRQELYIVQLKEADKDDRYDYKAPSEAEWRQFQRGKVYSGDVQGKECVKLDHS